MDQKEFEEARKQLVAKSNELVQNARQPLTKIQNEVLQYMVSKVKPTDEPGTKYTFKCSEFYRVMGYVTTSYTDIKALLSEMRKINWWIDAKEEGENDINLMWFDIVEANPNNETVIISFHKSIEPYIFRLIESGQYFSSYPFHYISLMKSFYSQKLYEQLNTHKNDKVRPGKTYPEWTYEIGTGSKNDLFIRIAQAAPAFDQRYRMGRRDSKTGKRKQILIKKYEGFEEGEPMIPESWKNFAIFKRDVLEPAVKEINTYTDMLVMYEPLKTDLAGHKYRRYTSIRFMWILKSARQISDTEELIDTEYQEIEAERENHQYTLEDVFGISLESRMDDMKKEQEVLEEEYDNYQETTAEDPNEEVTGIEKALREHFTAKEIGYLKEAVFNEETVKQNIKDPEQFTIEYIRYYLDKIRATSEDTRTTVYKRLLDAVRKDYDGIKPEMLKKHNPDRRDYASYAEELMKLNSIGRQADASGSDDDKLQYYKNALSKEAIGNGKI